MSNQLQIHLEPTRNAARTRFSLTGELLTSTPPPVLANLLRCLACISTRPVEFVLPVDCPDGLWFDAWTGTIDAIGVPLELRFALEPGLRTGAES
jgi:hypothetical protein